LQFFKLDGVREFAISCKVVTRLFYLIQNKALIDRNNFRILKLESGKCLLWDEIVIIRHLIIPKLLWA